HVKPTSQLQFPHTHRPVRSSVRLEYKIPPHASTPNPQSTPIEKILRDTSLDLSSRERPSRYAPAVDFLCPKI
uniref:Uncharacterized protein n=1 Tax=Aegilops tauschii subsp. strangulata TaxID=200361 RepID=A0A453T073_AEGTS